MSGNLTTPEQLTVERGEGQRPRLAGKNGPSKSGEGKGCKCAEWTMEMKMGPKKRGVFSPLRKPLCLADEGLGLGRRRRLFPAEGLMAAFQPVELGDLGANRLVSS